MQDKTLTCKECGKQFHISNPSQNARKYCSRRCRIKHNKRHTRISIRRCAWCNKEYVAVHTPHVSKFCCKRHRYYSKLQSNLQSVRKYKRKYKRPTRQEWLGNSNLKSHLRCDDWEEEYRMIQNEFKRLRLRGDINERDANKV